MKFEEAANMEEGTVFNVKNNSGGGWLKCYFENGIVHKKVGGKLAASIHVFNADWKLEEDNWNLYANKIMDNFGVEDEESAITYIDEDVEQLQQKILEDIDELMPAPYHKVKEIIKRRFGF